MLNSSYFHVFTWKHDWKRVYKICGIYSTFKEETLHMIKKYFVLIKYHFSQSFVSVVFLVELHAYEIRHLLVRALGKKTDICPPPPQSTVKVGFWINRCVLHTKTLIYTIHVNTFNMIKNIYNAALKNYFLKKAKSSCLCRNQ